MKMLFGGRMAEEIVFGRVTTGAADDLRRITEISRSMVEEYGMGSQLIARDDVQASALLSEATRAKRDQEQQALIDEAQWEARCLITDNRALLDQLAASLLKDEVLERDEIDRIMAGEGPELDLESIEIAAASNGSSPAGEQGASDRDHTKESSDTSNSQPPPPAVAESAHAG
jgi:ATP-dependent Zn protease